MRISVDNLRQGIKWWYHSKWPADFHNRDYYDFYQDRANGLNDVWLNHTVNRLAQWRALRSRKKPNTKKEFFALLEAQLPLIQKEYQHIIALSTDEPSTESVSWHDINSLYEIIVEIKNRSPVFVSKLGHFIFPKIFIVMDNLGTEAMIYDYYWQGMVNEWKQFSDKAAAIELLKKEITLKSLREPHGNYPYETRIMELCHVGDKWK